VSSVERLIAERDLRLEPTKIAGMDVLIVDPPVYAPGLEDVVVFNVHGGGLVMGTVGGTALLTASEFGMRVYSVDYTLSLEALFPTAIEQSLAVYAELGRLAASPKSTPSAAPLQR
jgi:epsilon-lactone hydrolase